MSLTTELLAIGEIRAALGVGVGVCPSELAPMVANLRRFALKVLAEFPESVPDEFEIQDAAVQFGLLVETQATEPCGPNCWCVEYHDEFPCRCYRRTPLGTEGTNKC